MHYANCLPDIHFTFSIFKFQFVNFRSGNISFALTKLSTRTTHRGTRLKKARDIQCNAREIKHWQRTNYLHEQGAATRCLHAFGTRDVEHCKNIFDNGSYAVAKCKSCLHKTFFFALNTASVVEFVEKCCKLCYIACNFGRIIILCRTDDFDLLNAFHQPYPELSK